MSRWTRRIREPRRLMFGCAYVALAVCAVLLLIGAGAWLWYDHRADQAMVRLRQQGHPTTLAEVRFPVASAAENAAADYDRLLRPDGLYTKLRFGEMTQEQIGVLQPSGLSAQSVVAIRRVLPDPRVQRTLEALRVAAAKPHCIRPLQLKDGYLSTAVGYTDVRQMARVCRYVAAVKATDGDRAAAGEYLLTSLHLARQMDDESTLIAWLVSNAIQAIAVRAAQTVLAAGELPAAQSAALQREIGGQHPEVALARAIRAECAASLGLFALAARTPSKGIQYARIFQWSRYSGPGPLAVLPPYWRRQQTLLAAMADRSVVALNPSVAAGCSLPNTYPRENLDVAGATASVWFSAARKLQERKAALGLLLLALKLNDFRAAHKRYPDSLAELPGPLPNDPFTGKPFRYRNEGASFLLYSVGQNRSDDGGSMALPRDREKMGDLVWGNSTHQPPL